MSRPRLRAIVWPGMPDPVALARAADACGVELEAEAVSSNERLERLMDERGPWDLVTPSDYMVEKLVAGGRLDPLDPDGTLDRDILSEWCRAPEYDSEEAYSWPLAFGTTGLLYLRDSVPDLASWAQFFRPGPDIEVGLLAESREVVGAALIAAGRDPNSTDRDSLGLAKELLDRQRPYVGSLTSDDFTGPVVEGRVAIHHAWSGPAAMTVRRNPGLGYSVPEEGALLWVTTAAIPADAPSPEPARRLLQELIEPRNARLAVENGGYSTPNEAVRDALPEGLRKDGALFPADDVIVRCRSIRAVDRTGEQAMLDAWADAER